MQLTNAFFYIIILMLSVIIHEVAHGFMAYRQGDPTAKMAGRLTLNPLKHIDLVGTILLPLFLVLTNAGFLFGWAKPVPYNPNNLRNPRMGKFLVSVAGVAMNILIAIVFSILIRFLPSMSFLSSTTYASILDISVLIVSINLLLAIFNLLPVPPLDGSRILFAILPAKFARQEAFLERYSLIILIAFVYFGWRIIAPVVLPITTFFTGIPMQKIFEILMRLLP
ncbi:MAG: hypothetical protein RL641_558 [Candidatus Parcubacteria bacterium]|jgi:Zn-dependent protease